jgi:flagellar biosynthesis/type III secretory pathway chaperone
MQPQAVREKFARHLADEIQLLEVLEQQLRHEHELLTTNDVEGLDKASGARQQTVAQLLRLDDDRRGLCRVRNLEPDREGLAALLTWCDPEGSLAVAQAECATRAQRCREQNDRNGALVSARLTRVSGMLGMIAGGDTKANTYQPHSAARGNGSQPVSRMVSTSA